MKSRNTRPGQSLSLAAILLCAGCAVAPQPRTAAPQSNAGAGGNQSAPPVSEINKLISLGASQGTSSTLDYRMGPDDLVQVTIYNIPEQDVRMTPRTVILRVSQQGVIVVPMVGEVNVKGMTTGDLQRELGQRYSKYIRNPQVGVLITEYRQRVSVMGAVQKPGVFELTGPKTVIDMLGMAGGVTERAGNQVHVYRQDINGERQNFVVDLMVLANNAGTAPSDSKEAAFINLPMQAGDVINVPQAGMFFVDGAVLKPGSYPLGRQYTLTQAVATAGGVDHELADYAAVAIMRRRGPTETETIPVDWDNVKSGKAVDPQLQPDDVIYVPVSGFKYFVKRFVGTMINGVSAGSFIGR